MIKESRGDEMPRCIECIYGRMYFGCGVYGKIANPEDNRNCEPFEPRPQGTPAESQHGREPDKVKQDNLVPMPVGWIGQYHNACNNPCDMLHGPCVCGAWHHLNEWIINRKKLTKGGWQEPVKMIDGHVKPLAQYLAEYLATGIDRTHKAGYPVDYTKKGLKPVLEQALDAYESTEQVKIRIERV